MRVMHELNQLEMGGAERVVLGIIRHDRKNNHIVYTRKDGPMRPILEAAGAEVIIEDKKVQQNVDCDLIHVHTGGNESEIASCVQGSIPTIETVHSPVVSRVRDEWLSARVGVSGVVTAMNRRCRTIYNGAQLDRLESNLSREEAKKALGIDPEAFVIGRLGRIATDKCVEEFLVACWKIQTRNPGRKIAVLICGGEAKSSPGYLPKVKVMAASFPLKDVFFVGETNEVGPLYAAMDVFMYPSPTEGFGLVYLEAMACRVPVVTWQTTLTTELFIGSALLAPKTVDGLVRHVEYLISNDAAREELADAGFDLAVNHFREETMSGEYQKLYDEIVPAPQDWEKIWSEQRAAEMGAAAGAVVAEAIAEEANAAGV